MKFKILMCVTALTVLSMLALPTRCLAQKPSHKLPHYSVVDLGTLGGSYSFAPDDAPNEKGEVNGFSTLPGDIVIHAFRWHDGRMIDLGTLGGPNSASPFPLNDWGAVPGYSDTTTPDPNGEDYCGFGTYLICRAFIWYNGVMITLPTLGGPNNGGDQLNDWGQMVGDSEIDLRDPSCAPPQVLADKPVIYDQGQVWELRTLPGDSWGDAFVINNQGQAAGYSSTNCGAAQSGIWHALLWKNGTPIYLGNLGGQMFNLPQAINNKTQVVGGSDLSGDTVNHAFLWQQRTGMIDLGTLPGYPNSIAEGINDGGQIVGGASEQPLLGGNCTAFLWQDGVMTDLNTLIPPGSPLYLCFASGINSPGQIAGQAVVVATGEWHAFLATPVENESDVSFSSGETKERSKVTMPENVRKMLQRRLGLRRGGTIGPQ